MAVWCYCCRFLLLVIAALFVWDAWQGLNTPTPLANSPLTVVIEPGASFGSIVQQLESTALLSRSLPLKVYAKLTHKASRVKAGEYQITSALTPIELLDVLIAGRTRQYPLRLLKAGHFASCAMLCTILRHCWIFARLNYQTRR